MTIEALKAQKQKLGLTNRRVSELSGIPLSTVNKIFGNTTASPRYHTLLALENLLFSRYVTENAAMLAGGCAFDSEEKASVPDHQNGTEENPDSAGYAFLFRRQNSYALRETSGSPALSDRQPGDYTISDYLAIPEGRRCELIDGFIYDMSAPDTIHQLVVRALQSRLDRYIRSRKGRCIPFVSPVDVQPDPSDDRTILQPDIFIVCDRSRITRERIVGAPDLVIEVISPSTRKRDLGLKANVYERSGVREYWLVDPDRRQVVTYLYGEDYEIRVFGFSDRVPVGIFGNDLVIDFKEVSEEFAFLCADDSSSDE